MVIHVLSDDCCTVESYLFDMITVHRWLLHVVLCAYFGVERCIVF